MVYCWFVIAVYRYTQLSIKLKTFTLILLVNVSQWMKKFFMKQETVKNR